MMRGTCWSVEASYTSESSEAVKTAMEKHRVEFDEQGLPVGRDITAEEFAEVAVRSSARNRCTGSVYVEDGWTEYVVVATATTGGYRGLGNGEQPAAVAMLRRRGEPTRFLSVGCEHEWKGGQAGRCYYTYRCTKCDCGYEVDSSD